MHDVDDCSLSLLCIFEGPSVLVDPTGIAACILTVIRNQPYKYIEYLCHSIMIQVYVTNILVREIVLNYNSIQPLRKLFYFR